jgi:hypothetical protein
MNRAIYLLYAKHDPVLRNAWQYYDGTSYGINSYMRPAALLRTLENHLGQAQMARIMRAWFQRYRFHHPTSADFEKLANEVSGRDLRWFFDQFVLGSNWTNYKVANVKCDPVKVDLGSFLENGRRKVVTEADAGRIEKQWEKKGQQYRIEVKLVRDGETFFPVDMKMVLDSGEVVWEHWGGRERWVKYEYTKGARVKSVEIDPERKILLDGSFADNSYIAKPAALPLAKWSSNILFWLQMVMQ